MSESEETAVPSGIIEEDVAEMEVLEASAVEKDESDGPESGNSESEEYEVEKIVGARFVKKKRQYLVKWVNYSEEWNTWEPIENLDGSHELVEEYNRKEREKEEEKERSKAAALAKKKAEKEKKEAEKERKEVERKEREEKKAKFEKEKMEVMEPSDSDNDTEEKLKTERKLEKKELKEDKQNLKILKEKKIKKEKKKELSKEDIKRQKRKEKLQKEREKWKKEQAEFRRREDEMARRKREQNAYKKKESGADNYEESLINTSLAFPEEDEKVQSTKTVNEETKIEEEASIRLLLSGTQPESEWQYNVAKKYRQFLKQGAKIKIIDGMTPFNTEKHNSNIGFSELVVELTGTPKVLSMSIKDLVDKLTQERYKKIPKVQKENKWIILNFLIRNELWKLICGKENSNFYDFQTKCFSKVAAGPVLLESNDKIMRVEGRDAGIGLAARRIATALTKEFKEANIDLTEDNYVPYSPRVYNKGGLQVQLIEGRMDPTQGEVRVQGVAAISSVSCHIHKTDEADPGQIIIEVIGEGENISKCKSCLISNEILTTHQIDAKIVALLNKEKDETDETVIEKKCIYSQECVIDIRCVVAHGLIGKIDPAKFQADVSRFGKIENVRQASPGSEWNGNSYNSFLVKYQTVIGAQNALNALYHYHNGTEFKFIPYRNGDMESERQSRFVLLQNLPEINEYELQMRFENEGVLAARLDINTPSVGYLLLSKKQSAQRFHKNLTVDFYPGRSCPVNTLDISHVTKVLDEESKCRIFRELEIGHTDRSDTAEIDRCSKLKWLKPILNSMSHDRKRKFAPSVTIEKDTNTKRNEDLKRNIRVSETPKMNILENIMSGIDYETDVKVIARREALLKEFQDGDIYKYWLKYALDPEKFKMPDVRNRYSRDAIFQRKKFEWSNSISEWVTEHRNNNTHMTPPDEAGEVPPGLEGDPDMSCPASPGRDSDPADVISSSSSRPPSEQRISTLMPTRRKRLKQTSGSADSPKNSHKTLETTKSIGGSLKNILGSLDTNLLEQLKNKQKEEVKIEPLKEEEIEEDPKQSIIANPPMELRTLLRALRIDKSDLKTLLDIPLAIISVQNVIGLVEIKNSSTSHMNKNDPGKLVELLKKYLTPPDEKSEKLALDSKDEKTDEFPEDIIYQNVEFREILTDCMEIFAEGKEIMNQLFDSFQKTEVAS